VAERIGKMLNYYGSNNSPVVVIKVVTTLACLIGSGTQHLLSIPSTVSKRQHWAVSTSKVVLSMAD